MEPGSTDSDRPSKELAIFTKIRASIAGVSGRRSGAPVPTPIMRSDSRSSACVAVHW
jgi:hypothetical protein